MYPRHSPPFPTKMPDSLNRWSRFAAPAWNTVTPMSPSSRHMPSTADSKTSYPILQNPGRHSWRWSWTRLGRGTHWCFGALSNAEGGRCWNCGQLPSRIRIGPNKSDNTHCTTRQYTRLESITNGIRTTATCNACMAPRHSWDCLRYFYQRHGE